VDLCKVDLRPHGDTGATCVMPRGRADIGKKPE
jgi:hypothetical protein